MSELDAESAFAAQMEAHKGAPEPQAETPPEVKQEVKAEPIANAPETDIFDPATLTGAAKTRWDETQKELDTERRRAADLQTRFAKLHGQVSPLQRELNRLKNQPATARAAPTKAPAPAKQDSPGLPDFRKTFGEDAAPIEAAFLAMQTQNQTLLERLAKAEERQAAIDEMMEKDVRPRIATVDQLREMREVEQYERESQEVMKARTDFSTKYPEYKKHIDHKYDENNEVIGTHLSPEMEAWLEEQPDSITRMLGPDATVKESNRALGLFYAEVINKTPIAEVPNDLAAKELENRKKNLANQVAPQTTGVPRMDANDLSDEDRFAARMTEHKRKRG